MAEQGHTRSLSSKLNMILVIISWSARPERGKKCNQNFINDNVKVFLSPLSSHLSLLIHLSKGFFVGWNASMDEDYTCSIPS